MADERAKEIDEQLFTLLAEFNITTSRNIEEIKKALEKANMEIVNKVETIDGGQLYTVKVCRVIGSKKFKLLSPEFKISNE